MTPAELARTINGRQYLYELTAQERGLASAFQLVVVCGRSTDLVLFDGVWDLLLPCPGGDIFIVSAQRAQSARSADAERCRTTVGGGRFLRTLREHQGYTWAYRTRIPHSQFDVLIGDAKYCRGVIFTLENLHG